MSEKEQTGESAETAAAIGAEEAAESFVKKRREPHRKPNQKISPPRILPKRYAANWRPRRTATCASSRTLTILGVA